MKRSLVFALALASLSLSVNAQQADVSAPPAKQETPSLPKIKLNDADREEMKKSTKIMMAGAQGFFGAIRSAVDLAHETRAKQDGVAAGKKASKSIPTSP